MNGGGGGVVHTEDTGEEGPDFQASGLPEEDTDNGSELHDGSGSGLGAAAVSPDICPLPSREQAVSHIHTAWSPSLLAPQLSGLAPRAHFSLGWAPRSASLPLTGPVLSPLCLILGSPASLRGPRHVRTSAFTVVNGSEQRMPFSC